MAVVFVCGSLEASGIQTFTRNTTTLILICSTARVRYSYFDKISRTQIRNALALSKTNEGHFLREEKSLGRPMGEAAANQCDHILE